MVRVMINNWWLILLRGAFAIAFAVVIFLLQPFFPSLLFKAMAFTGVVVLFGFLALGSGAITIIAGLRGTERRHDAWLLLAEGAALTAGGLAVLVAPALTLQKLIIIVAVTAFVMGVFEIFIGTHMRRHVADEWLLLAGGMSSLLFSAFLLAERTRELALLNWIALYALVNGLAMAGLALRLRGLRHTIHALAQHEQVQGSKRGHAGAA